MKTVLKKGANIIKEEVEKTLESAKGQMVGAQQSSEPPPNFYPEVNPEEEARAKLAEKRAFEREKELEQEMRQIAARRDQKDTQRLEESEPPEQKVRPAPILPSSGRPRGTRIGKPKQQTHDVEIRKGPTR